MILETTILGATVGYMSGMVIGKGISQSIVKGPHGDIHKISLDLKRGYERANRTKSFLILKNIALVSLTGYVYEKVRVTSQEMSIRALDSLSFNYSQATDKITDDRYDDYHAISEIIAENPDTDYTRVWMDKLGDTKNTMTSQEVRDIKSVVLANKDLEDSFDYCAINEEIAHLAEIQTFKRRCRNTETLAKDLVKGNIISTYRYIADLPR